jgi:crotonobetainyl-CoA:carnitine CoA-transferase CaiB-like acyl-CoA transferase
MGREDLVGDSPFARRGGRVVGSGEIHGIVSDWVGTLSTAGVVEILAGRGVPVATVLTPAVALHSPIVRSRREVVSLLHPDLGPLNHISSSGIPILFDGVSPELDTPAERLGASTQSVLREFLDIDEQGFDELKAHKAVF